MEKVNRTDTISFSTSGLSVIGIANRVLQIMNQVDTSIPSQYTLSVDPDTDRGTIVRFYQEQL